MTPLRHFATALMVAAILSLCFERHHPCGRYTAASLPPQPVTAYAPAFGGFVKALDPVAEPLRGLAPRTAVSISILFRNFRE